MTRQELKTKCLALAEAGDAQAVATLKVIAEVEEFEKSGTVVATVAAVATLRDGIPELAGCDPAMWETKPGQVAGRKANGIGV